MWQALKSKKNLNSNNTKKPQTVIKLKNSNCDKAHIQNVTKLKNSSSDNLTSDKKNSLLVRKTWHLNNQWDVLFAASRCFSLSYRPVLFEINRNYTFFVLWDFGGQFFVMLMEINECYIRHIGKKREKKNIFCIFL